MSLHRNFIALAILCSAFLDAPLRAQWWDIPSVLANTLSERSVGKLQIKLDVRGRYETKRGINFGKDPDIDTALIRTRLGMTYLPVSWLKVAGTLQDSRSPFYGDNASSTVRDPLDLYESYVELFPDKPAGFGMSVGRRAASYGEGRLIGTPQWGNCSRGLDQASVYYRWPGMRLEALLVSPVKIRMGDFNAPVLGDRIWGTYDVFPSLYRKSSLDFYVLHRDQNRPGGFNSGVQALGTDRLTHNTYGFRLYGPLLAGTVYSLEAAIQRGKVGPAELHADALFAGLTRGFHIGSKTFSASGEYKFASGTANPRDPLRSGTFDQLYAANHDRFGHQDLFSWRNLHNMRSLETLGLTKALALNFQYSSFWLANIHDALYNSSGKAMAQSMSGAAGRHVGEETDLFATYRRGHWLFGAGYGYLFKGEFVRNTTPGANTNYAYLFHTYSF